MRVLSHGRSLMIVSTTYVYSSYEYFTCVQYLFTVIGLNISNDGMVQHLCM